TLFRSPSGIGDDFVRIVRLFFLVRTPRQPAENPRPHLAPSLEVADAIAQDSIEERTPFLGRARSIAARELQHGILDDVQGIIVIAHGDAGNAIGTPLHLGKKTFELARFGQAALLRYLLIVQAHRSRERIRPAHSPCGSSLIDTISSTHQAHTRLTRAPLAAKASGPGCLR